MLKLAAFFLIQWIVIVPFSLPAYSENLNIVKPPKSDKMPTAKACGASPQCHERIYGEWKEAMHAHSTPGKDPLVKAFYSYLSRENIDTGKCNTCHVPLRAIYHNEPDENNALFDEGVTCTICHSIHGITPETDHKGISYYQMDLTNVMTGPLQDVKSPHDTSYHKLFRTLDVCIGCHQKGESDYISKAKRKTICQNCHMPSKQKQKSAGSSKVRDKVWRHFFEGGHSELLLSMATILDGLASKEGDQTILEVNIDNGAHHTIPTGFPLRVIYLKVTGLDVNDNPVWSNSAELERKDPNSYFALIYDEKDEIHAHYGKDVKPIKNQVLNANSLKTVVFKVPSKEITSFKAQLYYRLLQKRVVKKMKIDEKLVPEVLMVEETFYLD